MICKNIQYSILPGSSIPKHSKIKMARLQSQTLTSPTSSTSQGGGVHLFSDKDATICITQ
jgi:hypothetical protein